METMERTQEAIVECVQVRETRDVGEKSLVALNLHTELGANKREGATCTVYGNNERTAGMTVWRSERRKTSACDDEDTRNIYTQRLLE